MPKKKNLDRFGSLPGEATIIRDGKVIAGHGITKDVQADLDAVFSPPSPIQIEIPGGPKFSA